MNRSVGASVARRDGEVSYHLLDFIKPVDH
jgi:hypothetical protein